MHRRVATQPGRCFHQRACQLGGWCAGDHWALGTQQVQKLRRLMPLKTKDVSSWLLEQTLSQDCRRKKKKERQTHHQPLLVLLALKIPCCSSLSLPPLPDSHNTMASQPSTPHAPHKHDPCLPSACISKSLSPISRHCLSSEKS